MYLLTQESDHHGFAYVLYARNELLLVLGITGVNKVYRER
jgi:hypothetical protein